MGKARKPLTSIDIANDSKAAIKKLFGLQRRQNSGVAAVGGTGLNSTGGGSGRTSISGDFVKRAGDTMTGLLGFEPIAVQINSSSTVDLTEKSSSYIFVISSSSRNVLTNILGNVSGNILFLEGVETESFTIKDLSTFESGNIKTPGGVDFVVNGRNIILLIYDDEAGYWKIVATGDTFQLGEDANANNNLIKNVKTPVDCGDAVNKCYVDSKIASLISVNGLLDSSTIFEKISEIAQIYLVSGDFLMCVGGESITETASVSIIFITFGLWGNEQISETASVTVI